MEETRSKQIKVQLAATSHLPVPPATIHLLARAALAERFCKTNGSRTASSSISEWSRSHPHVMSSWTWAHQLLAFDFPIPMTVVRGRGNIHLQAHHRLSRQLLNAAFSDSSLRIQSPRQRMTKGCINHLSFAWYLASMKPFLGSVSQDP